MLEDQAVADAHAHLHQQLQKPKRRIHSHYAMALLMLFLKLLRHAQVFWCSSMSGRLNPQSSFFESGFELLCSHTSDLVFNQYFRNDIFVIEPVMKSDVFILWKYGIHTTNGNDKVKNSRNRFQNDFFLCWWMAVNQNPPHITKCCCPLVWTVDTNIVIVNFIVIILGVNKRTKNEKISLGSYLSWHLLSFRPN